MSGRSGNPKHIYFLFGLWSIFIIFDKSCLLRMPKFAQILVMVALAVVHFLEPRRELVYKLTCQSNCLLVNKLVTQSYVRTAHTILICSFGRNSGISI